LVTAEDKNFSAEYPIAKVREAFPKKHPNAKGGSIEKESSGDSENVALGFEPSHGTPRGNYLVWV
jgi:hypothetical protein